MENEIKLRDIKLVSTKARKNCLVSEPNYHTTKKFLKNLLAIEMERTRITINKLVYLCLSILEINKTVMYEFRYD